MVYSEFITDKGRCWARHSCLYIAFIKQLFQIRSKVSQNKTEQIKCNDINKNSILPPNNVVPQKQLCLQQSGCQATHKVNSVGL